jgi:asparagine synthase (glutamine-hydrolysing)
MPGIAGIVRFSRRECLENDLQTMVGAMVHSNRVLQGQLNDETCGLCVGWVAHERSFADGMPLVSDDRNIVIVFSGESFEDDAQLARFDGRSSRHRAKAAYLLGMYAEFGDRFYEQLNGWFAGVVIDRRAESVTLFNDRYGMGRLYIHAAEDEFLFSSEAKALLKVRPALREVQPERLAEYFRYNCVLGGRTLFRGVSLLPHASAWCFRGSPQPKQKQYFDFRSWENQPQLDAEPFYQQWAATVANVFPRYAREGADVALSSTAGLDTRLIMAALGEGNRPHPSYTFGGAWGELFDVRTGRKTAAVYNQTHQTIRVTEQFLNGFGEYARRAVYISDGTHDAFGAHDVFFNEIAREIAPVRLTGKFGSEIVRIRRLVPSSSYSRGLFRPEMQSMVEALPTFAKTNPEGHPLTRVATEEISWHEYARCAVEQSQLILRTPYMDNALVQLMYQAPASCRKAGDLQERYVKERAPEFARYITNLGRFTSDSPLVTKLWYYPFWAMFKVEYIYLYATPHWFTRLDRKLESWHLERLLSGRQKWEGYRIWMKTHCRQFLHDTLSDSQAYYTKYFDHRAVTQMVERHTAGTHNYLEEINRALTVELMGSTLLKAGR